MSTRLMAHDCSDGADGHVLVSWHRHWLLSTHLPDFGKGRPMIRYTSDGDFWDVVAASYWQREPFLFQCDPTDAPFDAASVFQALTARVDPDPLDWIQAAVTTSPTALREYRLVSFRRYGPQPGDGDFDGYFERLRGTAFGFNVHNLGGRNPDLLARTAVFGEHLTALPGSPVVRKWELDAFAGTYPATPFGIHRDNAGVFSFSLVGRRTYLLWPEECFEPGHPDLTRPDPEVIARHADAATRIDVEPGFGVYWPPSRWHVVLSDGNPFAVAQVSAYFDHADLGR